MAAVALAGCGAAETVGGGQTSTSHVDTGESELLDEAEKTRPPLILLESQAGRQEGVGGSFCVDNLEAGVGTCGDSGPVSPNVLSTVRPGEEVVILLDEAEIVRPGGCHSDDEQSCIGRADVRPLGCEEQTVAEIPLVLGNQTTWTVDLASGDYELDVFAYFEAPDGRSGDVTGSLGLRVDESAPLEVIPAPGSSAACPASR